MADKILVWLSDGNTVLLLETIPARGARWQPVTGWVEPGESPFRAALREVSEETGIRLLETDLRTCGSLVEFENRGRRVREQGFVALLGSHPMGVQLDPHEHTAFRWVEWDHAERELPFEQQKESLRFARKLLDSGA